MLSAIRIVRARYWLYANTLAKLLITRNGAVRICFEASLGAFLLDFLLIAPLHTQESGCNLAVTVGVTFTAPSRAVLDIALICGIAFAILISSRLGVIITTAVIRDLFTIVFIIAHTHAAAAATAATGTTGRLLASRVSVITIF